MLFAETRKSLALNFDRRRWAWVRKRHLPVPKTRIGTKRIYILPTAACAGMVLLLFILALLAINYENNLVYGLTFLLTAVLIIAMNHTHANLRELEVAAAGVQSCFAGEPTRFDIRLTAPDRGHRNLSLHYPGGDLRSVSLEQGESLTLELSAAESSRGWFHPGYLKIETRFPLGIFRAWTWIDLGQWALIYPKPVKGGELRADLGSGESAEQRAGGQDEFSGFTNYEPGMPMRQLAWKQYARGQGLYAKQFSDPVAEGSWLSWELWPEIGVEARLSRLCFWALKLHQRNLPFGLDLPGCKLEPQSGDTHLKRVLSALAGFGREKPSE